MTSSRAGKGSGAEIELLNLGRWQSTKLVSRVSKVGVPISCLVLFGPPPRLKSSISRLGARAVSAGDKSG